MAILAVRLRERLGVDASDDLVRELENVKADMMTATQARFEAQLGTEMTTLRAEMATMRAELRREIANGDADLRVAMAEGFSKIRAEMSDLRVDLLRWSFLFWVGQVVATATIMGLMLRSFVGR